MTQVEKHEFLAAYQDVHAPLMRFCMVKSCGIMDANYCKLYCLTHPIKITFGSKHPSFLHEIRVAVIAMVKINNFNFRTNLVSLEQLFLEIQGLHWSV
jgi:hypothetical protein